MKSKSFGVVKLLLLCFLVAVISSVPTLVVASRNRDIIEEKSQMISDFQGVLTIWNVDTFESGSQSKVVMLEKVSEEYSLSHKGVYFLVKNLNVEELVQNLLAGVMPDIITFGYGIGKLIEPILVDLSELNLSAVRAEILQSGMSNENLYAVGFLMGGYILASTEEKLSNANVSDKCLVETLNSAGFDVSTKTGQKHINSVVAGKNDYITPILSIQKIIGQELIDVHVSPSMYDAYVDFVSYNAGTMLVGTHRDLHKLSGRVAVGKLNGVKIEYLSGFTNLIQYAGVVKQENIERVKIAKEFVLSLLTEENQKLSASIGMVNVLGKTFYTQSEFMSLEENLNKEIAVPNLFNNG